MVTRSDLLAAQVAMANAEQQRVQAANSVALAYADYNCLIGEPIERTPELDGALPVERQLAEQSVVELIADALNARAEALSLQSDAVTPSSWCVTRRCRC